MTRSVLQLDLVGIRAFAESITETQSHRVSALHCSSNCWNVESTDFGAEIAAADLDGAPKSSTNKRNFGGKGARSCNYSTVFPDRARTNEGRVMNHGVDLRRVERNMIAPGNG